LGIALLAQLGDIGTSLHPSVPCQETFTKLLSSGYKTTSGAVHRRWSGKVYIEVAGSLDALDIPHWPHYFFYPSKDQASFHPFLPPCNSSYKMKSPVTSGERFPLRTQVNLTHQTAMTMAEVHRAWNDFHPRYSNNIEKPIAGEVYGTFSTRDERSGQFVSEGSECHWTADDESEIGGCVNVRKKPDTKSVRPTEERVEYHTIGKKGFDFSRQKSTHHGRPCVKTYIRPICKLYGSSITNGTYQKAIISGIPVLLDPQQDTFTYDPSGGGAIWRETRDTFGFEQDGITGVVSKDFGSGSYNVGEGLEARSVTWLHFTVDEKESLTLIRTLYSHSGAISEIELPRGSRPEIAGFDDGSDEDTEEVDREPNFTGRVLISVDLVDPNMA
jgi:hypothetical protein